jgi:hypothetical protein
MDKLDDLDRTPSRDRSSAFVGAIAGQFLSHVDAVGLP